MAWLGKGIEARIIVARRQARRPAWSLRSGDGPFRERLKGYGISPSNPVDGLWTFEKSLIGRGGKVIARFAPDITADDLRLAKAIEDALAA